MIGHYLDRLGHLLAAALKGQRELAHALLLLALVALGSLGALGTAGRVAAGGAGDGAPAEVLEAVGRGEAAVDHAPLVLDLTTVHSDAVDRVGAGDGDTDLPEGAAPINGVAVNSGQVEDQW